MSVYKKPEPLLVSNVNRLRPLIKDLPRLQDLNLTQVLSSEVTCRVCYGKRVVAIRDRKYGSISYSHCLHCNGLGTMRNGDGLG